MVGDVGGGRVGRRRRRRSRADRSGVGGGHVVGARSTAAPSCHLGRSAPAGTSRSADCVATPGSVPHAGEQGHQRPRPPGATVATVTLAGSVRTGCAPAGATPESTPNPYGSRPSSARTSPSARVAETGPPARVSEHRTVASGGSHRPCSSAISPRWPVTIERAIDRTLARLGVLDGGLGHVHAALVVGDHQLDEQLVGRRPLDAASCVAAGPRWPCPASASCVVGMPIQRHRLVGLGGLRLAHVAQHLDHPADLDVLPDEDAAGDRAQAGRRVVEAEVDEAICTACSWWARMSWRKPTSAALPRSSAPVSRTSQPSIPPMRATATTSPMTLTGCCHHDSTTTSSSSSSSSASSSGASPSVGLPPSVERSAARRRQRPERDGVVVEGRRPRRARSTSFVMRSSLPGPPPSGPASPDRCHGRTTIRGRAGTTHEMGAAGWSSG